MEPYSIELNDITYLSELTPHPVTRKKHCEVAGCGVNLHILKKEN